MSEKMVPASKLKEALRQIVCPPQISIEGACAIIDAIAVELGDDYYGKSTRFYDRIRDQVLRDTRPEYKYKDVYEYIRDMRAQINPFTGQQMLFRDITDEMVFNAARETLPKKEYRANCGG